MSGSERGGGVASLPPPQPRSPPLCRRELAKVQVLEREVGFLEDELKFHEGLQPASLLCKEVTNFVLAKPDPLVPITKKASRSSRFWKWLCCCTTPSSNIIISWICCHRCPKIETSRCRFKCRDCNSCCGCSSSCIIGCSIPNCHSSSSCCSCPDSRGCFKKPSCSCSCNCCTPDCCNPKCPSCLDCSCTRCCPRCPKVNCSNCTKTCWNPCYLCC